MTSSKNPPLPIPEGWLGTVRRSKAMFAVSFLLPVGLLALAVVVADDSGDWLGAAAVILPTVALAVGGYAVNIAAWRRDASRLSRLDLAAPWHSATLMRANRTVVAAFFLFVASGSLLLLVAPLIIRPNDDAGRNRYGWVEWVAPLLPYLSPLPVLVLLVALVRKRWLLGLGLSADGIYHWKFFGCVFFRWDRIVDIEPRLDRAIGVQLVIQEPSSSAANPEESWISKLDFMRTWRGRHPILLSGIDIDPVNSYYAIEFYRRHDDLRHELGTQAGVDRIRSGDFLELAEEIRKHGRIRSIPS